MYVHLIRRNFVAKTWRFALCLVVLLVTVVLLGPVWDSILAVLLTIVVRRWQRYAQWDPRTVLKWEFQWELLIVSSTGGLMAIAIFVLVYV